MFVSLVVATTAEVRITVRYMIFCPLYSLELYLPNSGFDLRFFLIMLLIRRQWMNEIYNSSISNTKVDVHPWMIGDG